jgi:hypothetical protein
VGGWGGLKVLSSEVDPAQIRFFRKAFIKERGVKVFTKSARPLIPRHLVQLLAIVFLIANRVHSSVCGLFLLHTVVSNGAKNKF